MNNQSLITDQWQLNGDCEKCRRFDYCKKPCTANKKRSKRALQNLTNAIINVTAPLPSIADNAKKYF